MSKSCASHEQVISKSWSSDEQVISKWWAHNEEVVSKSWARHEQVISKSSQSHQRFMFKLWENHAKVMIKSWKSHEKVMRKSWDSHDTVMRQSTPLLLLQTLQTSVLVSLSWMGADMTMACLSGKGHGKTLQSLSGTTCRALASVMVPEHWSEGDALGGPNVQGPGLNLLGFVDCLSDGIDIILPSQIPDSWSDSFSLL